MCACTLYAGGPVRARQPVRVRGARCAAVSRRGRAAGGRPRDPTEALRGGRRLSAVSVLFLLALSMLANCALWQCLTEPTPTPAEHCAPPAVPPAAAARMHDACHYMLRSKVECARRRTGMGHVRDEAMGVDVG